MRSSQGDVVMSRGSPLVIALINQCHLLLAPREVDPSGKSPQWLRQQDSGDNRPSPPTTHPNVRYCAKITH